MSSNKVATSLDAVEKLRRLRGSKGDNITIFFLFFYLFILAHVHLMVHGVGGPDG